MEKHRRRSTRRLKGESGYILIVTALLLVPLVVFTGFGVDLGSWYAQAAKQQRAVDAASLAGVVQLPNQSNAVQSGLASLKANGYPCLNSAGPSPTTPEPTRCRHPSGVPSRSRAPPVRRCGSPCTRPPRSTWPAPLDCTASR